VILLDIALLIKVLPAV
jgi:hypothetical protein